MIAVILYSPLILAFLTIIIAVVPKSQALSFLCGWVVTFFALLTPIPSCQTIFSLFFKVVPRYIPPGGGSFLCVPRNIHLHHQSTGHVIWDLFLHLSVSVISRRPSYPLESEYLAQCLTLKWHSVPSSFSGNFIYNYSKHFPTYLGRIGMQIKGHNRCGNILES